MILYPAIDIRDGKAVRLAQGDFDRETAYDDEPVIAARRWADGGARWLHVVDLDGARAGEPVNLEHVRRIVASVDIPVQLGGGLRDSKKVSHNTEARLERLATEMLRDIDAETVDFAPTYDGSRQEPVVLPSRFPNLLVNGGAGIAVGMATNIPPHNLREVIGATIAYIDDPLIDVDGLMEGPDLDSLSEVAGATDGDLIYSGGVGSLDDLRAIAALGLENLDGVIVGRALYEQRFTIAEARAVLG